MRSRGTTAEEWMRARVKRVTGLRGCTVLVACVWFAGAATWFVLIPRASQASQQLSLVGLASSKMDRLAIQFLSHLCHVTLSYTQITCPMLPLLYPAYGTTVLIHCHGILPGS
ncbi:uncharacterized protein BDR25DRAFT_355329 [Lindgomyces ingoldianus]|uniref:Uncharacterized protein n=1 Tax=Lindgomyces ingoldianus TaxID=673940 RepID=A0ACB6QUZ4_9PLEO|nr:uncharacterized protein BDR25DRAFT_355329 [Lindgomyces ingoldianus]KAF2470833.1 hypothetical protein BDR25DRAFT_355329 [Lindgomyces ingoldianus]